MLILYLMSIVYAQEAIHYNQQWQDQCLDGRQQSPIDVSQKSCKCDKNIHFSIEFVDEDMEVLMKKKEYTIQTRAPISKLYATSPDGTLYGYTATRFNFRSPSEHTLDGHHFDMELQLYHRISKEFAEIVQNELTIVSVFFEVSDTISQPFFETYDFSLLDQDDPTSTNITLIINPQQILGQQLDLTEFYNYQGSQTLFPCKEEVNWFILDRVLPISQQQLDNFNYFFKNNDTFADGKGNNRGVQQLNERIIRKQGITCQGHFLQDLMMFSMYLVVIGIIYKFI